jgi:cholesterol 7-desaturase
MKELLILSGIIPAYFFAPNFHPYAFHIITTLLTLPLLLFLYDFLFNELTYKLDVEEEFKTHKKHIGDVPPPFPNGWFKIAYSFEVKEKQSIYVEALGEHFVIFRGENGKATVMDAYCPHLGANLAYGGVVKDDCISCPFHGWKFDQNGKCVDIPYNTKGPVPEKAQIKVWHSKEVNQMILVWYHAENIEPTWQPPITDEIVNGSFFRHGFSEEYIRCHPQDLHENGPDSAHLNVVHVDAAYLPTIIKHNWKASWEPMKEDQKHMSKIQVTEVMNFLNLFQIPFSEATVNINQLGPGLVRFRIPSPFGGIEIYQCVTPIRPLYTRMDHICFAKWSVPRFVAKMALYNIAHQVSKDMVIWSNKMYRSKPLLCQGDGRITIFRQWYSQFYSENSITYQQLKDKESKFEW